MGRRGHESASCRRVRPQTHLNACIQMQMGGFLSLRGRCSVAPYINVVRTDHSRTAGRGRAMEMTVSIYESSKSRLILPSKWESPEQEKIFASEDCRASRVQKNTNNLRPNPSTARPLVFRDLDLFRRPVFSARRMRSHVAIAGIKKQAAANNCAKH